MSNQLYDEQAVREIIRLAMENEKASNKQDQEHGLTLDELVQIGKEVGLSEQDVVQAAHTYSMHPGEKKSSVTNTSVIEERSFISNLSKDELWYHLQAELDDHFGESTIFGSLTGPVRKYKWKHSSASGVETVASIRKQDNGYSFKISQTVGMSSPRSESIAIGLLPMFLFGILIFAFNRDAWLVNSIATLFSWILSSFVIYKLDIRWREKKRTQLHEFADRVIKELPGLSEFTGEDLRDSSVLTIPDDENHKSGEDSDQTSSKSRERN